MPSAPEPAKRSSTRAPPSGAEHREQRLADAVGGRARVAAPRGAASAPARRSAPATTLMPGPADASAPSARAALAEQHVLGRGELRVLVRAAAGAGVRALEQVGVVGQPGERGSARDRTGACR